jgi:SH3 domain protein
MGLSLTAAAQQPARYVSDELAIVLRGDPGNEGASLGVLTSGARVELLGAAGGDNTNGYVRVRSADGREGWVLERYLKAEPIARDRLQRAEKALAAAQQDHAAARNELAEAKAELKKVMEEHAKLVQDFSRIADSAGKPPALPAEVVKEAEDLRARIEQLEQERAGLLARVDSAGQEQRTLLLGGALVAGGVLLALLLHWLWPKRRWGDL